MIILTKLNGTQFALNSDLIETIDENHDTIIRLANKSFFVVTERMSEIIEKVIEFRKASCGSISCISINRKEESDET